MSSRGTSIETGRSGGSSRSSKSGKSSKSSKADTCRSRFVLQKLALPYGDTELLKTWLQGKYGPNFKYLCYKIGSFHIEVPEGWLVSKHEIDEIRGIMTTKNHYVNPWEFEE